MFDRSIEDRIEVSHQADRGHVSTFDLCDDVALGIPANLVGAFFPKSSLHEVGPIFLVKRWRGGLGDINEIGQ
jgi:hypothetical protein